MRSEREVKGKRRVQQRSKGSSRGGGAIPRPELMRMLDFVKGLSAQLCKCNTDFLGCLHSMWGKPKSALHREDQHQHYLFLCLTSFLFSLDTPSLSPPQKNYEDKMASNAPAEGVVTLKMINELQQQVLDNNPIYKYLLSDVSFLLPPFSPLLFRRQKCPY